MTDLPLTAAEELELDRALANVQRYPLELTADDWERLRTMASEGDRRGQLELLRSATLIRPAPATVQRSGDPVPAVVRELLDRLQRAEQRATIAEERVRQLEAGE